MRPDRAISGYVFRVEGKRRPMWRAKYRLPDGRQVQRTIGKVWTERARPPEGYFTKRTAQAWLRDVLEQAERGVLPGMVRTGRTSAEAAEEYRRYLADDRQRKPSTVRDARSVIRTHLLPPLGARALEDITEQEVERYARRLGSDRPLSNATKRKVIVIFHGVMARACRVYGLRVNPVARVEKPRLAAPGAIDVFSPEEVHALVRAATSEQDAALFLTAAFTGLRQGELVALRWRAVDFAGSYIRVTASHTNGELSTPNSGKVRSVPMARRRWARRSLGSGSAGASSERTISCSSARPAATSMCVALLRRYRAALRTARLPPLRFHDLRHTFGTRVIGEADIRRVQEWMGHADVQTTMRYLHYAPPPRRYGPRRSSVCSGRRIDREESTGGALTRTPGCRQPTAVSALRRIIGGTHQPVGGSDACDRIAGAGAWSRTALFTAARTVP